MSQDFKNRRKKTINELFFLICLLFKIFHTRILIAAMLCNNFIALFKVVKKCFVHKMAWILKECVIFCSLLSPQKCFGCIEPVSIENLVIKSTHYIYLREKKADSNIKYFHTTIREYQAAAADLFFNPHFKPYAAAR